MLQKSDILFQNLGIEFSNLGTGITVFGVDIAYYGIVIALGMVLGVLLAQWQAKRTGQNPEIYLDFALYAIIISVIGARLYYVAFSWSDYKDNLWSILDIRSGGLAIYGGVIAGALTAIVYCRMKKISFGLLADTSIFGLLLGQIIGRWGNFFNREAFGRFYDGIFSMQLNINHVGGDYTRSLQSLSKRYVDKPVALEHIVEIRENTKWIEGAEYISVHPTFLYESVWNLCLLVILIFYSKHKKFDGELVALYLVGYGLGRFWIEGLRTDQLFLWGSPLAVSQLLSGALVVIVGAFWMIRRIRIRKGKA